MFSRPDVDLVRLDSGHPSVFGALAFEGDRLLYLEAAWIDGVGLPDQLDEASLERLLISARANGYVLSVRDRLSIRQADGSFRERLYVDVENPDPMRTGGRDVRVHVRLGYDPALATAAWTTEEQAKSARAWADRARAAVLARFPNATVDVEVTDEQCMDIDVTRARGEALALRPMRREVFSIVADAGIVR